jgi:peptidylprolyl isomerase
MRSFFVLAMCLCACTSGPEPATPKTTVAESSATAKPAEPPGEPELKIEDQVIGTGAVVKKGSAVSVHYTGRLVDGTVFDSSVDRGKPFSFIVGGGSVIRGWEQGLIGMKVGGKRKLTIPPNLGYGDAGQPPTIPGHATLIFDIELLHVVE